MSQSAQRTLSSNIKHWFWNLNLELIIIDSKHSYSVANLIIHQHIGINGTAVQWYSGIVWPPYSALPDKMMVIVCIKRSSMVISAVNDMDGMARQHDPWLSRHHNSLVMILFHIVLITWPVFKYSDPLMISKSYVSGFLLSHEQNIR